MANLMTNSKVCEAEIVWCLHCVHTHKSNRAAAKDIQILKHILPDSDILNKLQLERTKIGYLVVFGLSPYFKNELLSEINKSENCVISFDESLNKISQSQQMDVVIRFWSSEKNEVSTRYLTSAFLKKATAADLLAAFLAAVNCIELKKVIQISMDGPNVNKKFYADLKNYLSEELQLETKLIELGTCGLHALHCSFKAAISNTGWNIIAYLRAVYNFFKDHPARRGMFTRITGSTIMPKKFCAVRWLENEDVAQNGIEMIPHLKKFVSCLEKEKSKPKTKSFCIMEEQLQDPLLGPKLSFFKTVAGDVQPLLGEFQSNMPLAPFLYTSIRNLVIKEMERFVVAEKISPTVKVLSKSENLIAASKVDIGIGAKCEIGKSKDNLTMLQVNVFKNECRNALKCLVERLLEKSPLQYEATKLITSLDPVISHTTVGQERFERLVILPTNNNIISTQTAVRAQKEFKTICTLTVEKLKTFKRVEKISGNQDAKFTRLDHFWMTLLLENNLGQSSLETVIKKLLVLSHGNADVERGFSINKDCLFENMKEESLVAVRTIHDTVNQNGGVDKVPITKSLILYCKNASGRYKEHLEDQKKKSQDEAVKRENKRRNQLLLRELEEKKQKLMSEARREAELIDQKISGLTKF